MNTQPHGLRLLCPQGCGETLTVPMPALAEVSGLTDEPSLRKLDTLVGRNVVGAVLMHCIYTCRAVSEGLPVMHMVGNPTLDSGITKTPPSSTPASTISNGL